MKQILKNGEKSQKAVHGKHGTIGYMPNVIFQQMATDYLLQQNGNMLHVEETDLKIININTAEVIF